MWKFWNGVQDGFTKEERRNKANEQFFPLARSAYRTRHLYIPLYNMSLSRLSLEERVRMEPSENERWLEIVITAKNYKRTREEAILLAAITFTSYFPNKETEQNRKRNKLS